MVEERHAFREAEGMGEGQVHDGRPDAHAARARGEVPGEEERVAREAVRGEVLLGHPDVVEAERLRQLGTRQLLGDDARGLLPWGALEDVVGAEAQGTRAYDGRASAERAARGFHVVSADAREFRTPHAKT